MEVYSQRRKKHHLLPKAMVVIIWLMALILRGEAKEIKVNALTLTGHSLPVFVEHDASIRTLKVIHDFNFS